MALLKLLAETFVNNTTMRGFGKWYRTKFIFLKLLWCVYCVSMIGLLSTSSYFLIKEYSAYHTTMQESEQFQEFTDFPAITVCSQQPLGRETAELWKQENSLTPKKLSNSLRQSMLEAYQRGELYTAKDIFFADKMSTFFQNLNVSEAVNVGLQERDMIIFCMQRHTKNNIRSVSHDEVCRVQIKRIRHPQYLNCYEILLDPEDSAQISSISLILQAGYRGDEDDESFAAHSQVHDLFTQSMGFRITLHDPGFFPDIDRYGFNVAVKTSTEVKYQIITKTELDLGVNHQKCLKKTDVNGRSVYDLGERYTYSHAGCLSEAIGLLILQECKCVSFFHLIRHPPNNSFPFCYKYDPKHISEMAARLNCVRNIRLPEKIAELSKTTCAKRCDTTSFNVQVIPSVWLPTNWQLYWVVKISTAWEEIESKDEETKEAAQEALRTFMEATFLRTHINATKNLNMEKLSLVTISRMSYNTVRRKETLQITLSALLAQIGGLGSLTIGCTLAIIFEIVEFTFLLGHKAYQTRLQRKQQNTNHELRPLS